MPPKEKPSKQAQLTDLVLEFLEAAVHQFLYVWKIYPGESFTKRAIYDVPVRMSRHPQLCEYIHSMLAGCRQWLRNDELEKLQVVLLSSNGLILRRLSIETRWNNRDLQATPSSGGEHSDAPLPLRAIAEEFRAAMVALTATPVTYGYKVQGRDDTRVSTTFRLLAHTIEDATRSETVVDEDAPVNSWVFADHHWHDGEEKESAAPSRELLPIKSIHGVHIPMQMQLYLEDL